jgi:tetratricopeptide (TPR) repeat protein
LAAQLREENEPQKAKEVLDRIMELTPHAKVPYDFFVNGIIEEYAKLGEIDAADEITKEFLMIIDDHLQYYLDLPQKFIKGADFETKVNMQYLNDLAGIASQYKLPSSTLAEEIMNENRAKFMQTFGRRGR